MQLCDHIITRHRHCRGNDSGDERDLWGLCLCRRSLLDAVDWVFILSQKSYMEANPPHLSNDAIKAKRLGQEDGGTILASVLLL